jgi:hypothetical protein
LSRPYLWKAASGTANRNQSSKKYLHSNVCPSLSGSVWIPLETNISERDFPTMQNPSSATRICSIPIHFSSFSHWKKEGIFVVSDRNTATPQFNKIPGL